jgi:hypothetical protein
MQNYTSKVASKTRLREKENCFWTTKERGKLSAHNLDILKIKVCWMSCGLFEMHVLSRNFLETRVNYYIKLLARFWVIQLDAEEEENDCKSNSH